MNVSTAAEHIASARQAVGLKPASQSFVVKSKSLGGQIPPLHPLRRTPEELDSLWRNIVDANDLVSDHDRWCSEIRTDLASLRPVLGLLLDEAAEFGGYWRSFWACNVEPLCGIVEIKRDDADDLLEAVEHLIQVACSITHMFDERPPNWEIIRDARCKLMRFPLYFAYLLIHLWNLEERPRSPSAAAQDQDCGSFDVGFLDEFIDAVRHTHESYNKVRRLQVDDGRTFEKTKYSVERVTSELGQMSDQERDEVKKVITETDKTYSKILKSEEWKAAARMPCNEQSV